MLRWLIPMLACPDCEGSLELADEFDLKDEHVQSGTLLCATCERDYPIEHSIPRLMPQHLLAAQTDEIRARDAQVNRYDANTFLNVFAHVEIPKTLSALQPQLRDCLLEAGCGTGRMTSILSGTVHQLFAVDFSFASLCANQTKLDLADIKNVHLIQGDLCNLPFALGVFDKTISCQVLEHVPGREARQKAVDCIKRVTKPGGTVVISAYQHSPLMGKKEGRHEGGIPFFRFTKQEFSELLGTSFHVESIDSSLIYIYLARCRRGA